MVGPLTFQWQQALSQVSPEVEINKIINYYLYY